MIKRCFRNSVRSIGLLRNTFARRCRQRQRSSMGLVLVVALATGVLAMLLPAAENGRIPAGDGALPQPTRALVPTPPLPRAEFQASRTVPANTARQPSSPIDFFADIKPIFVKHCFTCHGPARSESGLR